MGKTAVEKIFSRKLDREISAGDVLFAPVDLVLGTDGTAPLSIEILKENGIDRVKNPDSIVLINDHFVPAKDIASAQLSRLMRDFSSEQNIKNYYDIGDGGICHIVVPESGLVRPGDIAIGADSHTCTYGALGAFATGIGSTDMAYAWATGELWFKIPETIKIVINGKLGKFVSAKDVILKVISEVGVHGASSCMVEFCGTTIDKMDMAGRFTICNMAVEMGADAGMILPDAVTFDYFKAMGLNVDFTDYPDPCVEYCRVLKIDASIIEPVVACPYDPSRIKAAGSLQDVKIDQVVIGSCTNGRIEDFEVASRFLRGKRIHKDVRLIIIPGSQSVLKEMIKRGFLDVFIDAGAIIGPPTCGPCVGGHMGVLAKGEIGVYTTNRNFLGRNGHKDSMVYLASPAVAACSAIHGVIVSPSE